MKALGLLFCLLGVIAQAKEEIVTVAELRSGRAAVIGRLGIPVGELAVLKGKVVRSKPEWREIDPMFVRVGHVFLVEAVNGESLPVPIPMIFETPESVEKQDTRWPFAIMRRSNILGIYVREAEELAKTRFTGDAETILAYENGFSWVQLTNVPPDVQFGFRSGYLVRNHIVVVAAGNVAAPVQRATRPVKTVQLADLYQGRSKIVGELGLPLGRAFVADGIVVNTPSGSRSWQDYGFELRAIDGSRLRKPAAFEMFIESPSFARFGETNNALKQNLGLLVELGEITEEEAKLLSARHVGSKHKVVAYEAAYFEVEVPPSANPLSPDAAKLRVRSYLTILLERPASGEMKMRPPI